MALQKRIWRILMENKARYIGILILIFLASYTYVTASGIGSNLEKMVGGFAEKHLQEDLSFSTDAPLMDKGTLENVANAVIDEYKIFDAVLSDGQQLRIISPCTKINLPAVKSGSPLKHPNDILLDPYFCTVHDIQAGDSIEINNKAFNIVGTVAMPHYVYALKNINDVMPPSGFGIGLVSDEDISAYPESVTMYSVRFNDRHDINKQSASLHALLSEKGFTLSDWADAMNNKRIRMPWASITGVTTMSAVLPVAMFLLCCLIVGVMIWRMVLADSVIIGTFYAQGYRRSELTWHYMTIPLILAAVGGAVGVLLGLPTIAPGVKAMISTYYNVPDIGISISPLMPLLGILMPMAFLGLSCFCVIRKVLKMTARELMRGGEQKAKVDFLERSINLNRFKFETKFQLREQLRSIPRLLFLLLGVSSASILILFGFTINNSWNVAFDSNASGSYNFAIEYSFKQAQSGSVPEGCEPFNAMRCYPTGRETMEFYVMGMEPDSGAISLLDANGNELSKEQINITYPLANRLKLRQGDTIHFVSKLDGKVYNLKIDNIVATYTGQFIYMPLDEFNIMAGYDSGSYTGLFSDRELDIDNKLLSGVKDMQNAASAANDLAAPMLAMVLSITVIASLMGAIIIFLVTSLMIEENRATISLLKVFGYRKKEVAKLILNGGMAVAVVGFCIGIPLMLVSANAMYGYLGEMINMVLPIVINPFHILISFILIISVYRLTQKLCERKLDKITMSEALKANAE